MSKYRLISDFRILVRSEIRVSSCECCGMEEEYFFVVVEDGEVKGTFHDELQARSFILDRIVHIKLEEE